MVDMQYELAVLSWGEKDIQAIENVIVHEQYTLWDNMSQTLRVIFAKNKKYITTSPHDS